MSAYAIYRMPNATQCTLVRQLQGDPVRLKSCRDLNGQSGFVFAPFHPTDEEPLLLIKGEEERGKEKEERDLYESLNLISSCNQSIEEKKADSTIESNSLPSPTFYNKANYAHDFRLFHSQLVNGKFSKIVLARCSRLIHDYEIGPMELFGRACLMYPRMFVALISTPSTGTWLMATPEILLDSNRQCYRTMALAGTMRYEESLDKLPIGEVWSEKNRREQQCVTNYIGERLRTLTDRVTVTEPYTVRAAGLVHLRSDFSFTLPDMQGVGDVVACLHPTPAVCGMPKDEAMKFILANESFPRHYYSGFSGPIYNDGSTHLFVSLRCMHLSANHYDLYAGGGLLSDSVEQDEWKETEAKLGTMKKLFS